MLGNVLAGGAEAWDGHENRQATPICRNNNRLSAKKQDDITAGYAVDRICLVGGSRRAGTTTMVPLAKLSWRDEGVWRCDGKEGGKSFGQSGSKSGSSSGSRYGEVHGRGNPQGGSPRTMGIGSEKDYEKRGRVTPRAMDYVPSVANKAVTGKFFAREPEFNQMRDIKDAYQGYRPSKPSGGALRGMKTSEVAQGIASRERSRR